VIGVTDQGMLQKFAKANAATRQNGVMDRLVETMPYPFESYRAHVKRAIENINVSHRPDHGYQGALMEETSYGIKKDGTVKQKRKADGSEGRAVSNLIEISEPNQVQRHGIDKQGNPLPYKGYIGGSNYCIEITKNDKGKWEGEVISTFRAYDIVRRHGETRLRDPKLAQNGKPLIMRLFNNDSIRLNVNGHEQTMRIVKMAQSGQIWMAPINEANVDKRNSDKTDPFSYSSKTSTSMQACKARTVTISPIGVLHDPGFHE
jgi:CRISPR-associated endonuclease Csn1